MEVYSFVEVEIAFTLRGGLALSLGKLETAFETIVCRGAEASTFLAHFYFKLNEIELNNLDKKK